MKMEEEISMDPQQQSPDQTPVYPSADINQQIQPMDGSVPMDQPYVAVPTVVVPETPASSLPRWFSVAFILTLLVFFAVSTLLVLSMMQKQDVVPPTAVPTPAAALQISPSSAPLVSPTPSATESGAMMMKEDDSVEGLQAEVQGIEFSDIDATLLP